MSDVMGETFLENETPRARGGFEYYYALGSDRNLRKVSEYVGVTMRTILNWNRKYNWQNRVKQRDIEIGKKVQEKTMSIAVDEKAKYRSILQATVTKFMDDFNEGKVKIKSINDLKEVIKLDLLLMGESTEITTNNNNHVMTEEDRKLTQEAIALTSQRLEERKKEREQEKELYI